MKKIIAIVALVAFTGAKVTTVIAATSKVAITITDDKDKKKDKDAKCAKKDGKCCAGAHAGTASTSESNGGKQAVTTEKASCTDKHKEAVAEPKK